MKAQTFIPLCRLLIKPYFTLDAECSAEAGERRALFVSPSVSLRLHLFFLHVFVGEFAKHESMIVIEVIELYEAKFGAVPVWRTRHEVGKQ